jgi:hypothetical protein
VRSRVASLRKLNYLLTRSDAVELVGEQPQVEQEEVGRRRQLGSGDLGSFNCSVTLGAPAVGEVPQLLGE